MALDVTKREQYCLAIGSTSRSELMMMKSPPKYPSSTLMLDQDFSVHISDILPPEVVAPLSNPVSIGSPPTTSAGSLSRPSCPPPRYSPSEPLPYEISHPEKIISVPISNTTLSSHTDRGKPRVLKSKVSL